MFCPKCKKVFKNDCLFCKECGTRLIENSTEKEPKSKSDVGSETKADDKKKGVGKMGVMVLIVLISIAAIGVGVHFTKDKKESASVEKETVSAEKEKEAKSEKKAEEKSKEKKTEQKSKEKKEETQEETIPVKGIEDTNGYILADSSTKALTEQNLEGLTARELTYARNEIFARYGYVFASPELNEYFATKSWYEANPSYDGSLSATESANAELIKDYQQTHDLTYKPRPQVTADGEYFVTSACITYFNIENGYLRCETQSESYDCWNFEGIGTIYGLIDDTTEYAGWGSDEKKYEIMDYHRMAQEIADDRNRFLESVRTGESYDSPPGIKFIVQGGKITEVRRYTP